MTKGGGLLVFGGFKIRATSLSEVMVRFQIDAEWIPEEVRREFVAQQKNRITAENEFVISSEKTRNQRKNLEDALSKIQGLLDNAAKAAFPPPPDEVENQEQKRFRSRALIFSARFVNITVISTLSYVF